MTGRFDSMIYTDCAPGEGLQGSAGFQFQACSAGTTRAGMAFVQRHLLYEAPNRWMRERRPPADYPPSFSHTAGEFYGTAAGVYIGREAAGRREGNHLTHAVVTTDAGAYGLVRPAQMFQASFWVKRPAPATQCPPLDGGWQPGWLDVAQVQLFVRAAPRGAQLLRTLVSALDRIGSPDTPDARRVLFVARHTEDVMRWLTAATLLLPQDTALRIGFKVFTTNPAVAAQPVLAVHPDWQSSVASVDNDLGYVVVDLVHHEWSEVAPTSHATYWVPHFLGEDGFGVLDAIEFAHRCQPPDDMQARVVALAAVLHRRPSAANTATVVQWLRNGPEALVKAFGPGLVELILGSRGGQDPEVLRSLQSVAVERRLVREAAQLRRLNFVSDLNAVLRSDGPVRLPTPEPGQWTDEGARWARAQVEDCLPGAAGARFEGLQRLARNYGLAVSLDAVREAARAFVVDWVDHPGNDYTIGDWACAGELEAMLREELEARLQAPDDRSAVVAAVNRYWSGRMGYRADLATALDQELVALAMRDATPAHRDAIVRACLGGPDLTPARRSWLGSVLFRHGPPRPAEVRLILADVPNGTPISQDMFASLLEQVQRQQAVTSEQFDLCRELIGRGLLRPTPGLQEGLAYHARLPGLVAELAGPKRAPAQTIDALAATPRHWVAPHYSQMIDVLVDSPAHPETVVHILRGRAFFNLAGPFAERLCTVLVDNKRAKPANAVTALLLSEAPGPLRREMREYLWYWASRAPARDLQAARKIARDVSEPTSRLWNQLILQVPKTGFGGFVQRLRGRQGQ